MRAKDVLGREGESVAAAFLEGQGMQVVDRNWRCGEGEIDIVALDGDTLVIAEVLHERFAIPGALFGGLVLYTTLNTMLPSLLLHQPFDIDPLDAGEPWRHPEDVSPSGSTPPSSPPGLS